VLVNEFELDFLKVPHEPIKTFVLLGSLAFDLRTFFYPIYFISLFSNVILLFYLCSSSTRSFFHSAFGE